MNIGKVLKDATSGMWQAKLTTIGSTVSLTLSLLLLGSFLLLGLNTSRVLNSILGKIQMEAFLRDGVTKDRVDDLRKQLLAVPGIYGVEFVSKDDASKIFKEEFGEDINKVLDVNPLPPSFRITLTKEYQTGPRAENVQKTVSALAGIEKVVYRKEILEFIDVQARTLKFVAIGLGILIGLCAIFLAVYATRPPLHHRPRKGKVITLTQASYVAGGAMQGLLAGLIAAGILYYLNVYASKSVSGELADFLHVDRQFYGWMVAAGFLLGLIGSAISATRLVTGTMPYVDGNRNPGEKSPG